jgi:carbamoyltransferase
VALNCVGNGRLLRESPFEHIWIQPAAGDAGGALGAALFTWYQLLQSPRHPQLPDSQKGSLLGPEYESDEIVAILRQRQAVYRFHADDQELCDRVAALVASGLVVGWVQGRMEFGPRALGNRSILGDARDPAMQSRMNQKIKFRESFRPFAPIVLRERASEYFTIEPDQESPYMLQVAAVRENKRLPRGSRLAGLALAKESFSVIPAITHVDYSARVQTVDAVRNPRLHQLLSAFDRQTGCPVMINTSFNVRGEPIVCSPEDAYRCFMATNMDALVIGNFVLLKEEQPATARVDSKLHLGKFAPD